MCARVHDLFKKKSFSFCFRSLSKLCTDPLLFAEFGLISEFHIEIVHYRRNVWCKYNDELSNEEFDSALASFNSEPHTL